MNHAPGFDLATFRVGIPRAPRDVAVYVAGFAEITEVALREEQLLSAADQLRAQRVNDLDSRRRLLASRVFVRHVLAHHAQVPVGMVGLHHDPVSGAPHVVIQTPPRVGSQAGGLSHVLVRDETRGETLSSAHRSWQISVSRTPHVLAVVLAQRPVGIDVEVLQTTEEAQALLRVLNPIDQRVLRRRRPGAEQARAVTVAWTRVEALLKLRGTGLNCDPSYLRVCGGLRGYRPDKGLRIRELRLADYDNHVLSVAWQRYL